MSGSCVLNMRADIACTRPQQTAGCDLLHGVRHPANAATNGEQCKGTASRHPAVLYQRRKRDIDCGPKARLAIGRLDQRACAFTRLKSR
jgi:hypothetical protein